VRFFFLLLLVSCTHYVYYPAIPKQYISGKQDSISWTCQNEVGPDALWVKCIFKNEAPTDVDTRAHLCVSVAEQAKDGFSGWTLNSRVMCSSHLSPGDEFVSYGAFEGDDYKRAIDLCGTGLEKCWLTSMPMRPL
jgi:hypothetical protein